ncbi:MAG TPA: FAD:protein FMN transferase, partial [Vicinamibacterales bacterium]|nr:FAD:protein FMN transferase [Vicinamibacterales bacterium]
QGGVLMSATLTRRNFLAFDFGDRRRPGDHWIRVHRVAMACRFEVMLSSDDASDMAAARSALDEADDLETLLTIFRDSSVVSHVNRRAASEDVTIGNTLFALLTRSAELHAQTGGAFDVTSTPLSRCWGFLRREGRLPSDAEIEQTRASVGMNHVTFDPARHGVSYSRSGVEVSFGAIGKGYALDRMAEVLRSRGARRALLSAGRSSVLAIGGRGRGWPVDVRPRLAGRSVGRLWIRDGAVGTSGAGEQFIVVEGKRYGHVIDPRSGRPAHGALAASVVTGDAASADALSTAFLIGGAPLARAYCEAHPGTMAILVREDGGEATEVFGRYDGATLEQLP